MWFLALSVSSAAACGDSGGGDATGESATETGSSTPADAFTYGPAPDPDASSADAAVSEPDAVAPTEDTVVDVSDAGPGVVPDVVPDTGPDAVADPPDTAEPPPPAAACAPLPAPTGAVVDVTPDDVDQLRQWILDAAPGTTFSLADGTYPLSQNDGVHRLSFRVDGLTLRSASGVREAVVLDAGWEVHELLEIQASNVTIADLTVTRAIHHPIHVSGSTDGSHSGVVLHNLVVRDPGQQAVKINANGPDQMYVVDDGVMRCSLLEMTDEGRAHVSGCYTGGLDAHRARDWHIHDNVIKGFWCANGLSEHAIHLWRGCRDTRIERNIIIDCARGIGLGLGEQGGGRVYDDEPCDGAAPIGHFGGLIRNNTISAHASGLGASGAGFDTGIALEQACEVRVLHNTVASTMTPYSSIEWRWVNTTAVVANNAVTHNLLPRNGGFAELIGNAEAVPTDRFLDLPAGDLHLAATATDLIDQAEALEAGWVTDDVDGEPRTAPADIGADELSPD